MFYVSAPESTSQPHFRFFPQYSMNRSRAQARQQNITKGFTVSGCCCIKCFFPGTVLDNVNGFILFINLEYRHIIVNQQLLIASSGIFSNLTVLMCGWKRVQGFNSSPDSVRLALCIFRSQLFQGNIRVDAVDIPKGFGI